MTNATEKFYEYILKNFGENNPIFFSEIKYDNYSDIWKSKQLTELLHANKIKRFSKGIYFVPTTSIICGELCLNSYSVVTKKYIKNGSEYFGYYTGYSLLNNIGLSTQVPCALEICTNNERSKIRKVKVGNAKVLLRKTRVPVDSSNVAVLTFLELMNCIEPSYINKYRFDKMKEFIKMHNITRKDITKFAPYFPDKVFRNLVETEIIYFIRKK
ncbi:MAG: DUF6088 family protein [Bacilli bacterium]|nr:DUF6088 family protein [Bacilli bacterium]